ncbi:MAG: ABC transporter permease [Tidjanibacter sp.]|nr:ABC transporter permease [Tidjanibacter sp.]MBQ8272903.1 ABC transporter permease [Tidjanibacter sp.]
MARERVELFLASRIAPKKGERSGAMTGIARLCVAICFAVMLVALSVITGFEVAMHEKLTGMDAHITVEPSSSHYTLDNTPLTLNPEFEQRVATFDHFRSIAPFASRAGIIKSNTAMQGAYLRGVEEHYDSLFFRSVLIEGSLPRIGTPERKKDILLSQTLAKLLEVEVGDKVEFVFNSPDSPIRRDAYKVSGIYSTGMSSMEQNLTITDIRNVQRLGGWGEHQVSGYMIMADSFDGVEELCGNVRAEGYMMGGEEMWRTLSIADNYPQIFDWLATHDINGAVIIIIMLAVALLNMVSALLIIIFERIRTIGTLKALGMRNGSVQRVFLICGVRIVLRGMLWGNLIGGALLIIQHLTGFVALDAEAYLLSAVPVGFEWGWWLGLNILLPVVLLLLMMIPVAITSRIRPDQTLKYQ